MDWRPHRSSNREGDILLLQYNEAQEDNGHQHQEQEVLQQETSDDEKSFPKLKEQQQHDKGESEEDEDGAKIASGGPQETMAPRVVDDALMSVEDETSSLTHSFRDRRKIMTNTGATGGTSSSSTTATTTSSSNEVLFPMKLFHMLNDAADQGFDDIVSWGNDPNSFNVHKKTQFAEKVLPKYFKMAKYKSFTRQLHNYEFVWIRRGPDKGGYRHQNFNWDGRNLKLLLTRKQYEAGASHTAGVSLFRQEPEQEEGSSLGVSLATNAGGTAAYVGGGGDLAMSSFITPFTSGRPGGPLSTDIVLPILNFQQHQNNHHHDDACEEESVLRTQPYYELIPNPRVREDTFLPWQGEDGVAQGSGSGTAPPSSGLLCLSPSLVNAVAWQQQGGGAGGWTGGPSGGLLTDVVVAFSSSSSTWSPPQPAAHSPCKFDAAGGGGNSTKCDFPRHFEPRTIEEMLEDASEDAIILNPPQQVGGSRTSIDLVDKKQMTRL